MDILHDRLKCLSFIISRLNLTRLNALCLFLLTYKCLSFIISRLNLTWLNALIALVPRLGLHCLSTSSGSPLPLYLDWVLV